MRYGLKAGRPVTMRRLESEMSTDCQLTECSILNPWQTSLEGEIPQTELHSLRPESFLSDGRFTFFRQAENLVGGQNDRRVVRFRPASAPSQF
jgi:hypothetical protein